MLARDSISNRIMEKIGAQALGIAHPVCIQMHRIRRSYPRLGLSVTVEYFGFGHRTSASTDFRARLRPGSISALHVHYGVPPKCILDTLTTLSVQGAHTRAQLRRHVTENLLCPRNILSEHTDDRHLTIFPMITRTQYSLPGLTLEKVFLLNSREPCLNGQKQ